MNVGLSVHDSQLKVLRQLLAAGFIDQVAVRKDLVSQDSVSSGTQHSTSKDVPYQAMGIAEDVFIHPSSVLANASPPDFVVYLEVVRTSRVWIKGKFRRLSDNRIDFNHALGQD